MTICRLFLAATLITAGCARDRALIQVVPATSVTILPPQITGASQAQYRTVVGYNASHVSGDGGVLGWLIASAVSSGSEADGKERLNSQRKSDRCNEHDALRTAVEGELKKAGFTCDPLEQSAALRVKVIAFGLREVQAGWVVPYAVVSAALESQNSKKLWSATAGSTGLDRRRPEAYDAESYCGAFRAVAQDLASQLIKGPIRPLETH